MVSDDTSVPPPILHVPYVEAMLVAIQQSLLSGGFEYANGDIDTWPRSPVLMVKGDTTVLIWPWFDHGDEAVGVLRNLCRQVQPGGVLLIGAERADAPAIRPLLKSLGTHAAYIDAQSGQFISAVRSFAILTPAPKVVTKAGLTRLLATLHTGKAAAIDCRSVFRTQLAARQEAAAFFDRSRAAGGISQPVLTYVLVGLCVLVFAACAIWSWLAPLKWDAVLMQFGASFGPKERQGQLWRLVTCGFLHAGLLHVWLNMVALIAFGKLLEILQGRWRLGAVYLLSIVGGSIASLWMHPTIMGVGASGGIFGLAGGIAAVVIRSRRDFPPALWRSFRQSMVMFVVYNVVFQFLPMVDTAAHIGGLATGLATGLVIGRSPLQGKPVSKAAIVAMGLIIAAMAVAAAYGLQHVPASVAAPIPADFPVEP